MASGKEKNGIDEIYEKYYKDVYRFVLALSKNPHIAEDITQETFVKAIKAVDRFKGDCDMSDSQEYILYICGQTEPGAGGW